MAQSMISAKEGPKAPRDARKKRPGFYIMRGKAVMASPQPDGSGVQFLYQDSGRMISSARIVGNVTDEGLLEQLTTVEGFRRVVHSIGVSVETASGTDTVDFVFQMYGRSDPYRSGTQLHRAVRGDGMENLIVLEEQDWSDDDDVPGQIRFVFARPGMQADVSVRLYLNDGYDAPEESGEEPVVLEGPVYEAMISRSLLHPGNPARLQKALDRARAGEEITVAFIGGSITQGAGAVPIHTQCYARRVYEDLCDCLGVEKDTRIHYRKAGVGGTPSELGMIRYERDVLRMSADGRITEPLPDIVVVEFAVNDEGDETQGECYDSLVRKILAGENAPAVILLFAVFADDWNLQERLAPVGYAYDLPMVSVRNAVVEQFYRKGAARVATKNQFFYDAFHPSNAGHRIMADCVMHCIRQADEAGRREDTLCLEQTAAPIGGGFAGVRLLDRAVYAAAECAGAVIGDVVGENAGNAAGNAPAFRIDCGAFTETDRDLQAVETDMDVVPTPQFPHNWMYPGAAGADGGKPFVLEIRCRSLLLVFKDSGDADVGCAEVWVDGGRTVWADPHSNGWTHCNAVICFRDRSPELHRVEIRMAPGQAHKKFTVLGFGYVE